MRIFVGGTWHPIETVKKLDPQGLDESDRASLTFIRQWLNGTTSFSFRTSGSTGDPKPVSFTRDQLVASAKLSIQALGLAPAMKALVCLDPWFVAGAMMLARCLVNSMDIIVQHPSSRPFALYKQPVDFVALVPYQLSLLLEEDRTILDQPMIVIIGGAPLSESIVEQLQSHAASCYATYGMTETLTHIALRKLNGPGKQNDFHLLPGIRASTNEAGCLTIHAPHIDSPIVTHDLVEWTSGDSFRILGRTDEVINSGGVKVHPRAVEATIARAMEEQGYRLRFFVAGQPDAQLGERVCLIIEGSPLAERAEEVLLGHINQWLSPYERPRQVAYVPTFDETSTQKIDRKATVKRIS